MSNTHIPEPLGPGIFIFFNDDRRIYAKKEKPTDDEELLEILCLALPQIIQRCRNG